MDGRVIIFIDGWRPRVAVTTVLGEESGKRGKGFRAVDSRMHIDCPGSGGFVIASEGLTNACLLMYHVFCR